MITITQIRALLALLNSGISYMGLSENAYLALDIARGLGLNLKPYLERKARWWLARRIDLGWYNFWMSDAYIELSEKTQSHV